MKNFERLKKEHRLMYELNQLIMFRLKDGSHHTGTIQNLFRSKARVVSKGVEFNIPYKDIAFSEKDERWLATRLETMDRMSCLIDKLKEEHDLNEWSWDISERLKQTTGYVRWNHDPTKNNMVLSTHI